ncbi:ABC transporter substrate-binding protein [Halococcoides cellulosivorans]|uniref:Solute-binding protein family 5 domain-containing protein n=1 Tax=Halococcoides cellulosivorans TaxID=1679096 RepID=A0A2R4X3M1_9EURY|nr:ABC transporter substrate-binding protein [Halococcoides cellulosivorans]AWB28303.1 hypothetical protein HARCEL1_11595 [Halococcoides cellulosivorans]
MSSDQTPDSYGGVLDRRSFSKLAGASGAALLGGAGSAAGASADATTVNEVTVDGAAALGMDILHWNPSFETWPQIWGRWLTFDRFAQFNYETREWIPRIVEDWTVDGRAMTLSLRDSTYADGDAVTASDLRTQLVCRMAAGGDLADHVESFDIVDDSTLRITTDRALNPDLLEHLVLTEMLQTKDEGQYADWADRYWDDGEDVESEISSHKPDAPDHVSGPMEFVEMTDEYYLLERRADHPDAANINFQQYQFTASPGNPTKWRAMKNNEFDTVTSVFTPSDVVADLDDAWTEYQFPGYWGMGLVFNHDAELAPHTSDRRVRQAIAHAVDRETVANNAGPRIKDPAPTPAAIASTIQDDWIDVGNPFGRMQSSSEVASLMEEAGYTMNSDDLWEHPDRGVATIEILAPQGWSDWEVMAESVGSELRGAGFDAEVNRLQNGIIVGERMPEGNFQIACRAWLPGNERGSHPYFSLRHVLGGALGNTFEYPGWKDEEQPIEVPAMDGSGTMTVDVPATLDELATTSDDAEAAALIEKLAWVTHQDLPWLPIVTKREQSFINTQNLSAPAEDTEAASVKWPTAHLAKTGAMEWDPGEDDSSTIVPSDVQDVTVDGAAALGMDTLHWNPAFIAWPNIWGRWLVNDRLAQFNLETMEWIPRLVTDWTIDDDRVTLFVREDATWATGDPITAADVKTHLICSMAAGGPLDDLVESFDVVDEKTLAITATETFNPTILEFNVLSHLLQAKDEGHYADWADRYWTNDETDVGTEITSYKPSEPDHISGAMEFVEMTDEHYLLERNPEYYGADNINFERYQFTASPGNISKWRAMENNEFDTVMSVFTPSRIVADLDDVWNEYKFPGYWGMGLLFNHDAENAPHVSDRTVRQAIANAVDRQQCADNAGPRVKTPAPTPAAIAPPVQRQWIDVGGTFSEMQDDEQVAVLMAEAGYSKNSEGHWEHPDRGVATIEVVSPHGWSDWEVMANTVGHELREAGFDAEVNLIGNGTIVGERIPNGNFQIACRAWLPGNARSSFPYFPLRHVLGGSFGNQQKYPGWMADAQPIEVPAMDGSGTMEVNVPEALDRLATTTDADEEAALIEELAWVTHQDLPMLPIVTKQEQSFINTQNLTAPPEDAEEAQVKWPATYLPTIGAMQYTTDPPTVEDYVGSDGDLDPSEVMEAKGDYLTGDISLELAVSVMRRFFFG